MCPELFDQCSCCRGALREHEDPRGDAIEAVHRMQRALIPDDPISLHASNHLHDARTVFVPVEWNTNRLVDYQRVLALVQDTRQV